MTSIVSGLFGGESSAGGSLRDFAGTQSFSPVGFTTSLGTAANFSGNNVALTRGLGTTLALGDAQGGFLARSEALKNLLPKVEPGFGELTQARVNAIRDAAARNVSDIRGTLGNRRVLGSSFANDLITRSNIEFARAEEQAAAESFLGELGLTIDLINQQTQAEFDAANLRLQQANFETALAADLANQGTQAQAAFQNMQTQLAIGAAEADAANEAGAFEALGTIASLVAFSDRRLKRDIIPIGKIGDLMWYAFRYLWDEALTIGVMADEVLKVAPECVICGEDGYLRVNYKMLEARNGI